MDSQQQDLILRFLVGAFCSWILGTAAGNVTYHFFHDQINALCDWWERRKW